MLRFRVFLLLLVVLFALTSCAQFPFDAAEEPVEPLETGEAAETVDPPSEREAVDPERNRRAAEEYAKKGVELLQVGKADEAKEALSTALQLDADQELAKKLIWQIDRDPVKALGAQYFRYKVQVGDSLSKLAKRHLGDPYKFYILARYNNIDNPSRLLIGKRIKIPGKKKPVKKKKPPQKTPQPEAKMSAPEKITAPAQPVLAPEGAAVSPEVKTTDALTETKDTGAPEREAFQQANQLVANGEYNEAIALLDEMLAERPGDIVVENRLVQAYTDYAAVLVAEQSLGLASDMLRRALDLQPENEALKRKFDDVENKRVAESLYQSGLDAQTMEEAYRAFNDAAELDPSHLDAARKAEETKQAIISTHDRTAMQAFRRQELDTAIEEWGKVLELDPDNERAKLYRARSMELQRRIQEFNHR